MERITFQEMPDGIYDVMLNVETYIRNSGVDIRLLDLLRYRISLINHCAYCLDMHYKEALHHGEDPVRLYSVAAWREAPYYSDKERTVLETAEVLTELPGKHVDDALFDRLLQYFTKAEISVLTLAIAQINTWNRWVQVVRPVQGKYKVKEEQAGVE